MTDKDIKHALYGKRVRIKNYRVAGDETSVYEDKWFDIGKVLFDHGRTGELVILRQDKDNCLTLLRGEAVGLIQSRSLRWDCADGTTKTVSLVEVARMYDI